MFRVKSAAQKGQINSKELRESIVQEINEAGGKIDYAEVRLETLHAQVSLFVDLDLLENDTCPFLNLHSKSDDKPFLKRP